MYDSTDKQNPSPSKKGCTLAHSSHQLATDPHRSPMAAKAVSHTDAPTAGDRYPQPMLCTKTLDTKVTVQSTHFPPNHTITMTGPRVTTTSTATAISTSTVVPLAVTMVTVAEIDTATSFTETGTHRIYHRYRDHQHHKNSYAACVTDHHWACPGK